MHQKNQGGKSTIMTKTIKNLSLVLCLVAVMAFAIGCNNSSTDNGGGYYGDGGNVVTPPNVTGLLPANNLAPGQQVTISGTGFGAARAAGLSYVRFVPQLTGGTTLSPLGYINWTDTQIVCYAPSGLVAGVQYVIQVFVVNADGTPYADNGTQTDNPTFTAAAATLTPVITGPATAPVASPLTIVGNNFPLTNGFVQFNTNSPITTGLVWTAGTSVVVPAASLPAAGTYNVFVGGGTGGVSTAFSITLTGGGGLVPTVNAISGSFHPGDTVNVTGTNFVLSGTTINGLTGAVAAVSSTTALSFVVPAGTTAGTYNIGVTTAGGVSTTTPLVVVAVGTPTLTSVLPAGQGIGQVVTLTGTLFTAAATATIGGTAAPVTFVDAQHLTIVIPSVTTGTPLPVIVTVGALSTSAVNYTVAAVPPVTGTWHGALPLDTSTAPYNLKTHALQNGNILVVYGDGFDIYGRIYNTTTHAFVGAVPTQLDTGTVTSAWGNGPVQIASDTAGDIVVMYRETATGDVWYRLYRAGGWEITGPVQVTSFMFAGGTYYDALTCDSANRVFIFAYTDDWNGGGFGGVYAQALYWDTTLVTPAFTLGTATADLSVGGGYYCEDITLTHFTGTTVGTLTCIDYYGSNYTVNARSFDTSDPANFYQGDLVSFTGWGMYGNNNPSWDAYYLRAAANATKQVVSFDDYNTVTFIDQCWSNSIAYAPFVPTTPPVWTTGALKQADSVANPLGGNYDSSIVLLSDGTPLIAYNDQTWTALASTLVGAPTIISGDQTALIPVFGTVQCTPHLMAGPGGTAQALLDQLVNASSTNRLFAVPFGGGAWTVPTAATLPIDGAYPVIITNSDPRGSYATGGTALACYQAAGGLYYNPFY
jgi:hypothetical protein